MWEVATHDWSTCEPRLRTVQKKRQQRQEAIDNIPAETVAQIQSAGCKARKKSVIGAHNRCWKYLLGAISKHGEAKRDVEFIGEDKDRQLESLWRETRIGDVLPWEDVADEAQRLLDVHKASRNDPTKIMKMESRKRPRSRSG
jgi:hypothetical protein